MPARRLDTIVEHAKAVRFAKPVMDDFILDRALGALFKATLNFANAHATAPMMTVMLDDHFAGKKMRFAATTTAPGALIARRRPQVVEDWRDLASNRNYFFRFGFFTSIDGLCRHISSIRSATL